MAPEQCSLGIHFYIFLWSSTAATIACRLPKTCPSETAADRASDPFQAVNDRVIALAPPVLHHSCGISMKHAKKYVIISQKRKLVFHLRKLPIWVTLTAIIVIVIAVTSLLIDVPFLEIINTIGLVVLMASLGAFAWNRDKTRAYTFLGISMVLVFVLAFQIFTL